MNVLHRCAALAALMCCTAALAAQPPVYKFRDLPRTGSHLPRNVATSPLPFDKRYGDFTEAQKNVLRAQYEQLDASDEPPFPVHGLGPLFRIVAKLDRSVLKAGPVKAAVQVDPEGKPVSVRVLDAPNDYLTDFIANLLMMERYKPALCKGQPCGQDYLLLATLTDE